MPNTALFVNPWIYDFSAYDLWMKPFGLLRVANYLRRHGYIVKFYDCLGSKVKNDEYGCGKFRQTKIAKPEAIKDTPRLYYRYGVEPEAFSNYLKSIDRPDVVFVGSGMTYWYPGVQEAIRRVREIWGDIKVVLGGIYALLCRDHAGKFSGANEIWKNGHIDDYPAWDLINSTEALVVQTSYGCPFDCSYCGTHILRERFLQRPYMEVADEISYIVEKFSSKDIAFYDDALFVNSDKHIKPLLEMIIARNINEKVRFHTPNGVHARFIDRELANLLKKSGFATIRMGFETSKDKRCDSKVTNDELKRAVGYLKEAEFTAKELGVYTMFGSMDDTADDVLGDIKYVTEDIGIPIKVSTYSLVPGTEDFKRWGFGDDMDPLWHNKAIFPLLNKNYSEEKLRRLKRIASEKNRQL